MARPRLLPDNFTLALVATVAIASLLPCQGQVATAFGWITNLAIGLLFFLHGAKLSRQAIIAGATHWRLHLLVFACTFILFPILGLALKPVLSPLVTPDLYLGLLYLCALPATVQSSIAFTSLARGNIPAAVCSASASSLIGIFLTPLLVQLLLGVHGDTGVSTLDAIGKITLQLLVPFIAGQALRGVIGGWVDRHKPVLRYVDQGSILLVVYTAFSAAVIQGLWHQVPLTALAGLVVVCCILLAIALISVASASMKNVILAITVAEIPRVVRLIRGLVLTLREQPYVEAAVSSGASTLRIVCKHIFPNTIAALTVQATYICGVAILAEASLSFIGAGVPPSVPSWGNIMAEGRALWQVKPYIVFFPAVFLSITVLAVNLLGDGLRDALDPRLAKRL